MSNASLKIAEQPRDEVVVQAAATSSGGSLAKLVRGGVWTLGGRIWTALAGVIGAMCWVRVLSHEAMGDYNLAQALVMYGGVCGSLGFSLLVVRLTSAHLAAGRVTLARRALRRCLSLAMVGSLLLGATYYLVAPYVLGEYPESKYPDLLRNHLLMTAWLMIVPVSLVMAESFRGLHNIKDSVLFGGAAFQTVFIAGALVFYWLTGFGFEAMLWLAVAGASANLLLGFLRLNQEVARLVPAPTEPQGMELGTRELLSESLPLMLNLLFGMAIASLDLWIVALFFLRDDMANYGLAARIVLVIIMPVQVLQGVIPPMIAELHELKKRTELERLLRGSATVAAIPSFFAMVLILTTSYWSIPWLFGSSFSPAAWPLMILTFGQLISVLTGSPNFLLMMTGHQRPAAVCGVLALLLLVSLSAICSSVWGVNGVAVAAGIALSAYKVSLAWLGWRLLHVRTWVDPTLQSVKQLLAQRRR